MGFGRAGERVDRAQRAFELSRDGHTLRQVSDIMRAEGYRNVSHETCRRLINEHTASIILPLAEEHVKRQYERLEQMRLRLEDTRVRATEIADKYHVAVSHGQVILLPGDKDGVARTLEDDGPKLAAINTLLAIEDRILKIEERIAKLFGIDAAVNLNVNLTNETDRAISDLLTEMNAREDATPST